MPTAFSQAASASTILPPPATCRPAASSPRRATASSWRVFNGKTFRGALIEFMTNRMESSGRREFLRMMGVGVAGIALSKSAPAAAAKPLRGLFQIGFSPFTADNTLDLEGLAAQVKFCNRGGVHGFVWPQIASGWTTL